VGSILGEALDQTPNVELRRWSGAAGEGSYATFLDRWPRQAAPLAVVVVAGGRSRGKLADLCEGHVARAARLVDCFTESHWPSAVLHLGSAAELVAGSVYGAVKGAQRQVLQAACQSSGAGFLSLRLHSLVPFRRPDRGLFAELLGQWEAGGEVSVHHLGGARDYLTAAQLAIAVSALVGHVDCWQSSPSATVDIGNGAAVRVADWLAAFAAAFGRQATVEERAPGFDDPEIVAEVTHLRNLLERCDPDASRRYDVARPDLVATIRGWQAQA
jgi:nucleoside-diphosphate-sugar epimerase